MAGEQGLQGAEGEAGAQGAGGQSAEQEQEHVRTYEKWSVSRTRRYELKPSLCNSVLLLLFLTIHQTFDKFVIFCVPAFFLEGLE